uniref:Uncharacterized protein n=1 Tax=Caenorhabditis japonica TaxID=281687 RepID=A0A8R1IHK7_CAEJA
MNRSIIKETRQRRRDGEDERFDTRRARNILNAEPYGCSALVAAMFREIGNLRTFKQMTIRFNNSAVRDPGSI